MSSLVVGMVTNARRNFVVLRGDRNPLLVFSSIDGQFGTRPRGGPGASRIQLPLVYGLQYISAMTPAPKSRASQAHVALAVAPERHSMVVPRESSEIPPPPDSTPEFVSIPRRTLIMNETEAPETEAPESGVQTKTVVEPEEWIRARDQIALVVRSTIAEAMLPLQEAVASISRRVDALAKPPPKRQIRRVQPTPPRSTMLPPPLPTQTSVSGAPPPMAPSALTRLGDLAGKLRRQGIPISTVQLAALLLERAAREVDENVAAELARNAIEQPS
jgi:hypothetical protein